MPKAWTFLFEKFAKFTGYIMKRRYYLMKNNNFWVYREDTNLITKIMCDLDDGSLDWRWIASIIVLSHVTGKLLGL